MKTSSLIDYSTNVCGTCQCTWINETRLNSQQKQIPPEVGTGITNFLEQWKTGNYDHQERM
jgi:hypothetical protein